MHIIEFSPPMRGIFGTFNTFRLGKRLHNMLKPGQKVLLVNKKQLFAFGRAQVLSAELGPFRAMAEKHAAANHNWRHLSPEEAVPSLMTSMTKRYGPHRINENSVVTVIYLMRIDDGSDHIS